MGQSQSTNAKQVRHQTHAGNRQVHNDDGDAGDDDDDGDDEEEKEEDKDNEEEDEDDTSKSFIATIYA